MKKHPAHKHLLQKGLLLGDKGNWLEALDGLGRWRNATQGISESDIAIPLIWPYAFNLLTNGKEVRKDPRKAPVYLVWVERDEARLSNLADILMLYWWLLDRANIRFLVFKLRNKADGRGRAFDSPLDSPWWNKVDLFEKWISYGGYSGPS